MRLRSLVAVGALSAVVAAGMQPGARASTPTDIYRLTVWIQGQGSVVSSPSSIACPGRCAGLFAKHATIRLTPTPAKGWTFSRWSYACTGTQRSCSIALGDGTTVVAARFTRK
jgi:hypothetical protein